MQSGSMLDALIVAFLILQTFLGWRRGLLWQVAGVASMVCGVLLGWVLAPSLGRFVNQHIASNKLHARLVAFLFVLCTVGLVTRLLAAWVQVRAEHGLGKAMRKPWRGRRSCSGCWSGTPTIRSMAAISRRAPPIGARSPICASARWNSMCQKR